MSSIALQSSNSKALNSGSHRVIVASTLGNIFECFDLYIYSSMSGVIAKLYFPAGSETASLLLFLGTFGVSFFMRPLGAIYLGNLGDKIGRRSVMSLTLIIMTIGMLIMAFMPTYQTIGVAAPVGIVLGRMLQGFSAGGEFGTDVTPVSHPAVTRVRR